MRQAHITMTNTSSTRTRHILTLALLYLLQTSSALSSRSSSHSSKNAATSKKAPVPEVNLADRLEAKIWNFQGHNIAYERTKSIPLGEDLKKDNNDVDHEPMLLL